GTDGTVRIWDITAPQEGPRLASPMGQLIRSVALSEAGQRLHAIEPRPLTWELTTGRVLFARAFDIPTGELIIPALSRDGACLALAGAQTGNLFVFEAMTGKEVFAQRGDKLYRCQLAFSPDGRLLAEISREGWVRVRDVQTGRVLKSLEGHRSVNVSGRVAF